MRKIAWSLRAVLMVAVLGACTDDEEVPGPTGPGSGGAGGIGNGGTGGELAAPEITDPASPLPAGEVGVAYEAITFVADGSAPITWTVSAGSLPDGLTLDESSGVYEGTPTVAGVFDFTVTASNGAGEASADYAHEILPAVLDANVLLGGTQIATFSTNDPLAIEPAVPITGLTVGETLVAIARRPVTGFLYGLGYNAVSHTVALYVVDTKNGAVTQVGASGTFVAADGVTPVPVGINASTLFAMDFDPAFDHLRVVNTAGQNFRMTPNTGAFIDGNLGTFTSVPGLNMDGGLNGTVATVQGMAYTNAFPNQTVRTVYTVDANADVLCLQESPQSGNQTQCKALSPAVDAVGGFDVPADVAVMTSGIPVRSGFGFGIFVPEGGSDEVLGRVDLTSGEWTELGAITTGAVGLAIHRPPGIPMVGITAANQLLRFDESTLDAPTTINFFGHTAGEALVGIDYLPANGKLYALGINATADTGTLYVLDPQIGLLQAVGSTGSIAYPSTDFPPADTGWGMDFNPEVDRLRVVAANGLNFRVNPINGAVVDGDIITGGLQPDTPLNGDAVTADGVAYTNSLGGSTFSTPYAIDAVANALHILFPANIGILTTVAPITIGGSPLDFSAVSGFDIQSHVESASPNGTPATEGSALAVLVVGGETHLYSIDLVTGEATDMGELVGPAGLIGLAVGQVVP